jgi:hypothetical protein
MTLGVFWGLVVITSLMNELSLNLLSNRVNVADDILAVLNKFNDSSFIKEVITTNPQKTPYRNGISSFK